MARSTVPPPPPAPDGGAGAPVPGSSGASKPASKAPAKKPAAQKPAAAKPAAANAEQPVASLEASPTPAALPAAAAARPDPYAPAPPAVMPPGPRPSPYAGAPAAQPATLSVLSLVFGVIGLVLSLFLVGLLPAIAGVILGHLAMKREPHARGMAIAGLVTGYVGIAISVLWALIILVPIVLVWIAVGAVGVTGGF